MGAIELLRKYAAAQTSGTGTPAGAQSQPVVQEDWTDAIPFPGARLKGDREATSADWDKFLNTKAGAEYKGKGLTWSKMLSTLARARSGASAEDLIAENRGGPRAPKAKNVQRADAWWRSDSWWNPFGRDASEDPAAQHAHKGMPSDLTPWEKRIWAAANGQEAKESGRSAVDREAEAVQGMNTTRAGLNGLTMGASDLVYKGINTFGPRSFAEAAGADNLKDLRAQFIDACRRQGMSDDEIRKELSFYESQQQKAKMAGGLFTTLMTGGFRSMGKPNGFVDPKAGFFGRLANGGKAAVESWWRAGRYMYPLSDTLGYGRVVADRNGHDTLSHYLGVAERITHDLPMQRGIRGGMGALFPSAPVPGQPPGLFRRVLDGAVDDVKYAPLLGIANTIGRAAHDEPAEFADFMGIFGGNAYREYMRFADTGNTTAKTVRDRRQDGTLLHKDLTELLTSDRDLAIELVKNTYGLDDEQAAKWVDSAKADSPVYQHMAQVQQEEMARPLIIANALRLLSPDSDIDSMSAEQQQELWDSYSQEERAQAMLPSMSSRLADGGFLPQDLVDQLNSDQRKELVKAAVKSSIVRQATPEVTQQDGDTTLFGGVKRTMNLVMAWLDEEENVFAANVGKDPHLVRQLRPIMVAEARDAMYDPGSASSSRRRMFGAYFRALSAEDQRLFTKDMVKDMTPEQLCVLQKNANGFRMPAAFDDAMNRALADRMDDKGFATAWRAQLVQLGREGAGGAGGERGLAIFEHMDLEHMEDNDLFSFARCAIASVDADANKNLTVEQKARRKAAEEKLTAEVKKRFWANPLGNLPALASLYAAKNGFGGAADWLENPVAFYGTALLLIGGVLWLGASALGGDDDDEDKDEDTDASGIMKRRKKQQELGDGFLY